MVRWDVTLAGSDLAYLAAPDQIARFTFGDALVQDDHVSQDMIAANSDGHEGWAIAARLTLAGKLDLEGRDVGLGA